MCVIAFFVSFRQANIEEGAFIPLWLGTPFASVLLFSKSRNLPRYDSFSSLLEQFVSFYYILSLSFNCEIHAFLLLGSPFFQCIWSPPWCIERIQNTSGGFCVSPYCKILLQLGIYQAILLFGFFNWLILPAVHTLFELKD